jgi:hypothetical protein
LASAFAKSKADSTEDLVLISLPTMAVSTRAAAQSLVPSLSDLRKIKIKPAVDADPPALLNVEALALSEDALAKPASGSGDAVELARRDGAAGPCFESAQSAPQQTLADLTTGPTRNRYHLYLCI